MSDFPRRIKREMARRMVIPTRLRFEGLHPGGRPAAVLTYESERGRDRAALIAWRDGHAFETRGQYEIAFGDNGGVWPRVWP